MAGVMVKLCNFFCFPSRLSFLCVKTKSEVVITLPMTSDGFSSSCSNGLQVSPSQPMLIRTDILATGQNYTTVQGEKKSKDKGWGWGGWKESKRKHGSHSMLRFCTFVSPEVNTSVRNQRFAKSFSPSKLEGEPSAQQDGALLKGCRQGLISVTPG